MLILTTEEEQLLRTYSSWIIEIVNYILIYDMDIRRFICYATESIQKHKTGRAYRKKMLGTEIQVS